MNSLLTESPFNEAEAMELAADVLGVNSEQELDQFLGGLLQRAASAVQKVLGPEDTQALGGLLKGAVRKILPRAGRTISGWLGPAATQQLTQLAPGAARALGIELEGLSPEDQELAAANQLVQLAGAAAAQAAAQRGMAPPVLGAQRALAQAAQTYAPGLLRVASPQAVGGPPYACNCGGGGPCHCHHHAGGRWVRHGGRIVLYGV
jgi:hypothetical protein